MLLYLMLNEINQNKFSICIQSRTTFMKFSIPLLFTSVGSLAIWFRSIFSQARQNCCPPCVSKRYSSQAFTRSKIFSSFSVSSNLRIMSAWSLNTTRQLSLLQGTRSSCKRRDKVSQLIIFSRVVTDFQKKIQDGSENWKILPCVAVFIHFACVIFIL